MITDMERIGDQASDIAEIITMPVEGELLETPGELARMGEEAARMVRRAIDAYVKRDVHLAHEVIQADDIVDDLFVQVRRDLVPMIRQHPDASMQLLDVQMIAKYLERIGDHAVNIAEWVEYAVTGLYKGERL
jgi:phosphate transport system protein